MEKETFEEFKAKLQKKYPKRKLIEKKIKINEEKELIKIYGYCTLMNGKKGIGLVGEYYMKVKPEKLRLVCRRCSHEWIRTRPKGYHVKYNRKGNFLVNIKDRTDIRFFKCPKCGERKNIGRLAYSNKIKINENVIKK